MKNKKDIVIRRVKRISITYFCETDGQFSESFELPEGVITDEDAYRYAFNCERNLLKHHKQYPFCVFERRFFYQLSDGVVVAKCGNDKDRVVKYTKESGNIFVNGELTSLYDFLNSDYFKSMSPEGKDVFERFLINRLKISSYIKGNVFNFLCKFIKIVVFKHETVDAYSDYAVFKRGDIYKPFGLKEENL